MTAGMESSRERGSEVWGGGERRRLRTIWVVLAGLVLLGLIAGATKVAADQLAGGISFLDRPASSSVGAVSVTPAEQEALSVALQYGIGLPTWLPADFTAATHARVSDLGDGFVVLDWTWSGPEDSLLALTVVKGPDHDRVAIGDPLAVEAVALAGGRSAAWVAGGWNANSGSWAVAGGRTLMWSTPDATFRLSGLDEGPLVQVAESMP